MKNYIAAVRLFIDRAIEAQYPGTFRIFRTQTKTRLVGYWLRLTGGRYRFRAYETDTVMYGTLRTTRNGFSEFKLDHSDTVFYGWFE